MRPEVELSRQSEYLGQEAFDVSILHLQPDLMFDTSYERARLRPRDDVYRIGIWYWELSNVPAEWPRQALLLDEIWAPTRFIADALSNTMPVPVTYMLPGLELPRFPVKSRCEFGLPDDHYLFLFAFDMRSSMERKNPIALIRAFRQAFSPNEKVSLAIKVACGDRDPRALAQLKREAAGINVVIIEQFMTHEDAYGLINACDCFASFHRSEGFGLCIAEAMAMGKPVIATGYSGNMDFMTSDDTLLVNYELASLEYDIPPYRQGNLWAKPSVAHGTECLRWVYEHPAEARALGKRGQQLVRRVLSLESAARRMSDRLAQIRQLPRRINQRPKKMFRFDCAGQPTGRISRALAKVGRHLRYYGAAPTVQRSAQECQRFASRQWRRIFS
ncbi:MAG: glycosyltransferase family 4 protein [Planctomycetes bacterium]|nr:glycosyltransferase family 4 protein [Planctomycetota bacterium]